MLRTVGCYQVVLITIQYVNLLYNGGLYQYYS